ncbi:MAG: hypothetical protein H7836_04415 [Magnetococcus sp. YQC-3]
MSWEKIEELKKKIKELTDTQSKVDKALAKMPAGKDKDRLLAMKKESRGIFEEYIVPGWKKIQSLIGNVDAAFSGEFGDSNTMGILPLLPIAAVLAASTALGYVAKSIYTEQKILNDPALTAAQKAELLKQTSPAATLSSVADVTSNLSKVAFIVGGLFVAIKFGPVIMDMINARKKA